jgi:peptide deformylase
MILPIVKVPAKILTSSTKPVKSIDAKIQKLVQDMEDTLVAQTDPEGVGLAAPQVDVPLALFIMKPSKKEKARVVINPIILKVEESKVKEPVKKKKNTALEGCLSVDKIWSPVTRPHRILLQYQDIEGTQKKEWFDGFDAVIIQHEVDHLHGILFTQRSLEQGKILYKEIDGELHPIQGI